MRVLKERGFKLALTGRDMGNRDYIEEKIAEYGLQDCVVLPGFVSDAEMVALYRNAFAMTFASFCGPDNLPPLEAMALGCPVICAEFTGAREQLGDCALYFDPRDEQGIIAGVQALDDATLRQHLTTAGRELARGRTTAEYLRQMFSIIDEFAPYRECWSSREFYIYK